MKHFKNYIPQIAAALQGALLIMICYIHSVPAGEYVDFNPTNGTFQNFNPVRRLLSGQVPCRDFFDYLGLGHLFSGSFVTKLFGGDFQASLVAFTFLTILSFALLSVALAKSITNSFAISLGFTNALLISMLVAPDVYTLALSSVPDMSHSLLYPLSTGNSARFVRGMVLPLLCLVFILIFAVVPKITDRFSAAEKYREMIYLICASFAAGVAFIWSNDYGISCWVCTMVMVVVVAFSRKRNIKTPFIWFALYTVFSVLTVFITISLITKGHFSDWFSQTFGNGGYQAWYYNSNKSYYLWDVDFAPVMLVQAFVVLVYLWKIFAARGSADALKRFAVPAFANMTGFCAANEYKLMSGGNLRHIALCVLFLTVVYEIASFIISRPKLKFIGYAAVACSVLLSSAWLYINTGDVLAVHNQPKKGIYFEELGGNLEYLAPALISGEEFLDGEKFFSTYASGQETVCGFFHPSGTDYIIHVLGDEQREKYLDSFQNGDFRYAVTLYGKNYKWEHWSQRSNWYLYRPLFADWHPVFSNTYNIYWERNTDDVSAVVTDNISVSTEDIGNGRIKVIVNADKGVNGVADVYLDYKVSKTDSNASRFMIRRMLRVENTGHIFAQGEDLEGNNLRDESREHTPVTIVDGYGEALLTSMPDDGNTYIELYEASCEKIYTVSFDYVKVSEYSADNGSLTLRVSSSQQNSCILDDVTGVYLNGKEYSISDMYEADGYICIPVNAAKDSADSLADYLEFTNMVKVIKG